jgi:hypothetical protein
MAEKAKKKTKGLVTVTVKYNDAEDGPAPGQNVCIDVGYTNCKVTDANGKVSFSSVVNGSHRVFVNATDCCGFTMSGLPVSKTCFIARPPGKKKGACGCK